MGRQAEHGEPDDVRQKTGDSSLLITLKYFTDTSTAHGLHHVNHASGIVKKVVWTVITLCALAALVYHIYSQVTMFLSYSTTTSQSLVQQASMTFPAVTVCNNNPVMKNKVFNNPRLASLLYTNTTNNNSSSSSNNNNNNNGSQNNPNTTDSMNNTNNTPVGQPVNNGTGSGNNNNNNNGNNGNDQNNEPGSSRPSLPGTEGRPVRGGFATRLQVQSLLASLTTGDKAELGHSVTDLIVDCEFSGADCYPLLDFTSFYNPVYGNCYTFNSGWNSSTALRQSYRPGPQYGLSLVFNVDQVEYLGDLSESAGLRVLIHNQTTMPFPEDGSIAVGPGLLTYIGSSVTLVSRQGVPYGECVSTNLHNATRDFYQELYPVDYSDISCFKTCLQRQIVALCQCGDSQFPLNVTSLGTGNIQPCDITNTTQVTCVNNVQYMFNTNRQSCQCYPPCNVTRFSSVTSSMLWPSDEYQKSLLNTLAASDEKIKPMVNNEDLYRANLGKIVIYLQSFDVTYIEETPSYELFSLLSDIGGILGLYVGFSLLTILEFVDLVVSLLQLIVYRFLCRYCACCQQVPATVTDSRDDRTAHDFDNIEVSSSVFVNRTATFDKNTNSRSVPWSAAFNYQQ